MTHSFFSFSCCPQDIIIANLSEASPQSSQKLT